MRIRLCVFFLMGCSSVPELEPPQEKRLQQSVQLTTPADSRGFAFNAANSRFRMGSLSKVEADDTRFVRLLGTEGAVTTWQNGYFASRPHSYVVQRPALRDSAQHRERVLQYFVSAGLPSNEVGEIAGHTTVEGTGAAADAPLNETRRLVHHTTILTRKIEGFVIVGSRAWAQLDENGDVIREDVWWPTISGAVIAQARDLKALLDDPTRASQFRAALPEGLRTSPKAVVIHHSAPIDAIVTAKATIDIAQSADQDLASVDETGRIIHPATMNVPNVPEGRRNPDGTLTVKK